MHPDSVASEPNSDYIHAKLTYYEYLTTKVLFLLIHVGCLVFDLVPRLQSWTRSSPLARATFKAYCMYCIKFLHTLLTDMSVITPGVERIDLILRYVNLSYIHKTKPTAEKRCAEKSTVINTIQETTTFILCSQEFLSMRNLVQRKPVEPIQETEPIVSDIVDIINTWSLAHISRDSIDCAPSEYGFGFLFRWIFNILSDLANCRIRGTSILHAIFSLLECSSNLISDSMKSQISNFVRIFELVDIHSIGDSSPFQTTSSLKTIETKVPSLTFSVAYFHFLNKEYKACISALDALLSKEPSSISELLHESSLMLLGSSMLMMVRHTISQLLSLQLIIQGKVHVSLAFYQRAHQISGSIYPLYNAAIVFSAIRDEESEYRVLTDILQVGSINF